MNNTQTQSEIQIVIDELKANPVEKTGHVYHPIPFKEFESLKTSSKAKSAYRKWNLIINALPYQTFSSVNILDVGANAGFYSYQFAKLGATIDAYEPTPRYAELGQSVTKIYNLPINWHPIPLTVQSMSSGKEYDIAIMLSVFQWMSEGNTLLDQAKVTLQHIAKHSRYIFFELGCNYGKSAIKANGNSLLWIRRMLQENTDYTQITYLGSVRAWGFMGVRYLFACSSDHIILNYWQRTMTKLLNAVV